MANKVFENTARKIVAYSDDGAYRFIATRRANQVERRGQIAYRGSFWTLETFQRKGGVFVPYTFPNLPWRYEKKQEIIDVLQNSVRFTEAYKELTA